MLDWWTCQRLLLLAEGAADRSRHPEGSPGWADERDHFLVWAAAITADAVTDALDRWEPAAGIPTSVPPAL